MRPLNTEIKLVSFFPVNLSCINFIISLAQELKMGVYLGGRFSFPHSQGLPQRC